MKYFFAIMICCYSFINFAGERLNPNNQRYNEISLNQQQRIISSSCKPSQINLRQALAIQSKGRYKVSSQKRSGKNGRSSNPR